jgi:nucleotide-binding universal stress UspA family protein/hemerythrin-like domain-containing protein
MFTHLLVPVDDSVLSDVNARDAVRLARRLGARITFFRACVDLGATGAGARLKQSDPRTFTESTFGDTHAELARHAVLAEEAGVPHDVVWEPNDHPADAIVRAAKDRGCDMIVMATHGKHGLSAIWHPSNTERVLRLTDIPVLVTRVAASEPVQAVEHVLTVLHDEHQSITAVALALQDMVHQATRRPTELDLLCLDAMLDYLQTFPLRVHHPKEELILHNLLRQRAPQSEDLLADIEGQHAREHALVAALRAGLEPVMSDAGAPADALLADVLTLCEAILAHIALEETTVIPLARQHLQGDDWDSMVPAFQSHRFPGFGGLPAAQTRHLFTRIAELHLGAAGHSATAWAGT